MTRVRFSVLRRLRPMSLMACCALAVLSTAHAQTSLPLPDHVMIVIEENHSYAEIIGNSAAPYINSLAQEGASFSNSFAITHPSEPNYLALFSGSTQGVTDDGCTYKFTTPNLGRELLNGGWTFGGYSEDMPSVGYAGCSYQQYWRKHNPWVDWQDTISPSANSLPGSVNMPFTNLPTDFNALPTVSIVVPNQNNDMHDGTIQQADTWLQQHIDPYVQWANANNSLLILTWDEDDSSQANRIPTIFIGPMVLAGQYAETITHYNVLRTIEEIYGLPYAGNATAGPITDIWITSLAAPSNLTATAVSRSQINLSWVDNTSSESGFQIERSTDGTTFTQIATVGVNVTTYANTGLLRNKTYYYRVRAYDGGVSSYSNTARAKTLKK